MDKHVYAVVLAGGRGTRLWPESRRSRPKQFCRLGSDKTLLELTLARLDGFIPPARRVVVTQQEQYDVTAQLVGKSTPLAAEIIVEPVGRGTLAAVGLATLQLLARDPHAVIVSLHADAAIKDITAWQRSIEKAVATAAHDCLVLLGARPSYAARNYDYIARGAPLPNLPSVHQARFHYRPTQQEVDTFVQTDGYFWNSGIFIWRAAFFQQELRTTQRRVFDLLTACVAARGKGDSALLHANYLQLEPLSVDAGLLAASSCCVVLPLDCGWLDIGSWDALAQFFPPDEHGNLVFGDVQLFDCRNTTANSSDLLVAAVGLQDVVIVATADAVLVCSRARAQEVRELVARLPARVL